MSSTISNVVNHTVTLTSNSYADPITITGTVDASSSNGIFAASAWTVDNTGLIEAATGDGIFLKAGGQIDNAGSITAGAYGIIATTGPVAITNSGYISGQTGGVELSVGTITLSNLQNGIISGASGAKWGVKFSGDGPSNSTLTNDGTITSGNTLAGGGEGVMLSLANAVNQFGGVITGGSVGIQIGDYSNLTNNGVISGQVGLSMSSVAGQIAIIDSGTINGFSGIAVRFGPGVPSSITDSFTLLPGAVLDGVANGGSMANAFFGGLTTGTIATIAHELTLFPTITVETGADWRFSGVSTLAGLGLFENNGTLIEQSSDALGINSSIGGAGTIELSGASLSFNSAVPATQIIDFLAAQSMLSLTQNHTFAGTIENFSIGDTIDISGFGASESVTGHQSGNLFSWSAGGMSTSTITFASDPGTLELVPLGPTSQGTAAYELIISCFRSGTRILTPDGPRSVDDLSEGDLVVTHHGKAEPLIWIGRRWIDCDRHPDPATVLPVLIEQGAFSPGVPSRDLYVSPDHSIYIDRVLIPAKHVINGVSIRQIDVPEITYYHIELEHHNVVWAETLPVETYLECGNRHNFATARGAIALHASFEPLRWDAQRACATLIVEGDILINVRKRLHLRLLEQGHRAIPGSFDVYADGRLLESVDTDSSQLVYRLPVGTSLLCINSSSSRPADLDPNSSDCRNLGIAITELALDGDRIREHDVRLIAGFHAPEHRGRRWYRWTDGKATINATGVREISFTVQAISPRWQVSADGEQTHPFVDARVLELH